MIAQIEQAASLLDCAETTASLYTGQGGHFLKRLRNPDARIWPETLDKASAALAAVVAERTAHTPPATACPPVPASGPSLSDRDTAAGGASASSAGFSGEGE